MNLAASQKRVCWGGAVGGEGLLWTRREGDGLPCEPLSG